MSSDGKGDFFDKLRDANPWITCGYDEKGRLRQIHKKTHEIRVLDEWMEITRDEQ